LGGEYEIQRNLLEPVPMIKKSIANRFDKELAQVSIKQGKKEYRRLLEEADDLGPGNPMAMNAYFAYVFAAAWLGSDKKITPDEMAEVMTDVLTPHEHHLRHDRP